jgi:hypothetical protein
MSSHTPTHSMGFMKGRSTVTNLTEFPISNFIIGTIGEGNQVDVV